MHTILALHMRRYFNITQCMLSILALHCQWITTELPLAQGRGMSRVIIIPMTQRELTGQIKLQTCKF